MTIDPSRSGGRGRAAKGADGASSGRLASAAAAAEDAASRWPLGRIIAAGMMALAVVLAAAIVVGAVALGNLASDRNRVVNTIDPAAFHGSQLYAAMLNQETGLRGYLLSGEKPFLVPYTAGIAQQHKQDAALQPLLVSLPAARTDLTTALRAIEYWRSTYAQPAISKVGATGAAMPGGNIKIGKTDFNAIRGPMGSFQTYLAAQHREALSRLRTSADVLDVTGLASAIVLILVVVALGLALRAAAIRPLTRLASDARQVARGDFDHEVDPSGPREVHTLAVDVNRMRQRILRELSAVRSAHTALEARAHDLERSNAELEQFAYVASHDLQEPLRKVASFCQLLQRRYIGQLDARADQYIEFAVDGAKRMQALIDDLLAFSRVGRGERALTLVSCAKALSQARVNLTGEMRRSGAVIETTELPSVRAEFTLLTSLFQNLISNAIKFRGEQPPAIRISATRRDDEWLFGVADNGIGVEPEFADRVFVIFQRLHDRTQYAGTGIGLAMCRKIVEHLGGRIWLDTAYQDGAKFSFTLPVAAADDEETWHD
ncbi:MAG TPA: ATP-binding protein [Streptosporangiaceae bacterium]|nr:ATP-binding protein [Streptosporangiaceae bacterium]